jgi:hypothetical protein
MEPDPPEPEPMMEPVPDPCATLPVCDMTCPAGTMNPVTGSGCLDTCSCETLPDACRDCDSDEECVELASEDEARYACAGKVEGCVNILPCGCFEDYGNCTLGLQGVCQCEVPPDPCGGCDDGKRCIYQQSGQAGPRYLCASANNCEGPADCSCILQQGQCTADPNRGVCACGYNNQ